MKYLVLHLIVLGSLIQCEQVAHGEDYDKDVAPLFRKYCTSCHNPDDPKGGLSVGTFDELMEGGAKGAALLPGDAKSSRLIRMLTGEAKPIMPPKDQKRPTDDEIAVIRRWIEEGAKGPQGTSPKILLETPTILPAPGIAQPVTSVAWSPNGTTLAVARHGVIEIRSPNEQKTLYELQGHAGKINRVRFDRDGKLLVVASGVAGLEGEISLWKIEQEKGTLVRRISGHRDLVYSADISPDGKTIASGGYDRQVILWNLETGEEIRRFPGHNDAVYDVAFHPEGKILASASGDQTVKLWQVETGVRLDTLSQPLKEQYCVAFSPDGKFVTAGGADNRIRVWKLISLEQPAINPLVHARFGHEGPIVSLAYSTDGSQLVSVAEDRTLKLWDAGPLTEIYLYERLKEISTSVTFSPDKKQIALGRLDGTVVVYPTMSGDRTDTKVQSLAPVAIPFDSPMNALSETDLDNDLFASAQPIALPASIQGKIHSTKREDVDCYRFLAKAGQEWVLEIEAARSGSELDSRLEILDEQGNLVPRILLQAVRDSYFTFRGKDSTTVDDFRVQNWQEMELNEYLYCNGEIVKLWLHPRGPDSGFMVYPGFGARYGFFDTTPIAHALGESCYIVQPHPLGTELIPNGLPLFTLFYENDDQSKRQWGADSQLTFQAPRDGTFYVRVTDTRGFSGEKFQYKLTVRPRQPRFKVTLTPPNGTIHAGTGRDFSFAIDRIDGFEDPIQIEISGLPPGFHATTPITVEKGQERAFGAILALKNAPPPTPENAMTSRLVASAKIGDQMVVQEIGTLGELKLAPAPKLLVSVYNESGTIPAVPPTESEDPLIAPEMLALTIHPGETISAMVKVVRREFDQRIEFGNAPGINLPFGVIVDNIGLNGLLLPEGQTERQIFLTASPVAEPMERIFFIKTNNEGGLTSWPVLLKIVPRE